MLYRNRLLKYDCHKDLCFEKVYDTQDEDTTYERVQQLPYLDLVLKEGMRMFPVAPFIVRTGNF